MSTKKPPLSRAKAGEITWSGRALGAIPGLANYQGDAAFQLYFSTAMHWGSLATKTSKVGPIPFNFNIADIFTVLKTAPVSTGSKKFRIGTTTDDDLFFVTGNFAFASTNSTVTSAVRRGSATNFVLATGSAGMHVQFKLPPTTATVKTAGQVFGCLVLVPKA